MDIQLTGRNLEITPHLQTYVNQKVKKLNRYLPNLDVVRVDLAIEKTRSNSDRQVAQLTLRTGGTMLRAEERAADMLVAIDTAVDKMRRQIRRYKTRRQDRWQRVAEEEETEEGAPEEVTEGEIVRVKRFEVVPMTPPEAIEQMELLGHQFFVFLNADEGSINVLYRRNDGNYGLIMPETR